MKRLVIYFHYDAQGLLDGPCRFAVEALLSLAEVFLVTNGTLRMYGLQNIMCRFWNGTTWASMWELIARRC